MIEYTDAYGTENKAIHGHQQKYLNHLIGMSPMKLKGRWLLCNGAIATGAALLLLLRRLFLFFTANDSGHQFEYQKH